MLLPALNSAREKARRISCTSNLKQIGLAAKQYSGDFQEKFPCSKYYYSNKNAKFETTAAAGFHNGPSATLLMSQNYNTDYKTYVCPSGTLNGIKPATLTTGVPADTTDYGLQAVADQVAQTNLSYGFIAGMDENDSPDSGLAFDTYDIASKKCNHESYGNVVFVDGSARNFAGAAWAANISYYGAGTATSTSKNDGSGNLFADKAKPPKNQQGVLAY